jgi:hypothetical protein
VSTARARTSPLADDEVVVVCSECLRASCWQYVTLCREFQNATPVRRTVAELRAMNREHESHWVAAERLR